MAALLSATVVLPLFGAIQVDAAGGVAINETNFPDPNFRACIKRDFDSNGDSYLSKEEIFLARNVHCENSNVYFVKGIEHFPYLEGLWCKGNHISEMDLSGNPELRGIWCSFNDFTSLDFSDCKKLEWVYCFNCQLESLNVRNNPAMAFIECNANPNLKELDVSQNDKLENLFCSNCGLTSLDLSNNPLLCELAAFYNDLESLDVSNNPNLKRLDYWHNERLGNVDVSNLPGLQYLNCAWTKLTSINVRNNPELVELVCGYNKGLKNLDVSQNPKLAYLAVECDVNLKKLDITHNPRLYYLLAFGLSSIDTIDISRNSRLCKAYNEGVYVHETEKLGYVYSMTLDYGGSSDPFDELRHIVCFDDRANIIGTYKGTNDVADSVLDTNDGYSDSEQFATRGEAMQKLYELVEKPAVYGTSRFTDVSPDSPYADAIKWGEDNKICFGYPNISSDTFCPDELISRQDFALMAHRYATVLEFGTAFDYGRTDWFNDFFDIDFYAWGPFTWAIQWSVLGRDKVNNLCHPRGRMTISDLEAGAEMIFNLDDAASYSGEVGGNEGDPNNPPVTPVPTKPTTPAPGKPTNPATPVPGQPTKPATPAPGNPTKPATPAPGQPTKPATPAPGQPTKPATPAPGQPTKPATPVPGQPTKPTTPEPTPIPPVTMPNVVGMDYEKAQDEITRAVAGHGFSKVVFTIEWVDNEDPEKDMTVLKQDPEAGKTLYGNDSTLEVTLTVAKAPTFEDFVERLYTVALNRASEPEGKEFWIRQVVEEGKTGADCARFFLLDADEFMKRNLSVEDFVETLYATFFDRESDPEGKAGWVDAIKSGKKTRAEVVNDFIESTEWCDVCATYGVKSGALYHKATKASRNAINFATRLYTCCLKRDAEADGIKYWSLALTNLEQTGASAAKFFFEGEEFVGFKTTDKEYLNRLYTTFMDREPAASEVDFWIGEIKAGRQTRKSILSFFAQSPEFTDICKKYGIDRGEI